MSREIRVEALEIAATESFTLRRTAREAGEGAWLRLSLLFPWSPEQIGDPVDCPGLAAINSMVAGDSPVVEIQDFAGVSLAALLTGERPVEEFAYKVLRALAEALDSLNAAGRTHGAVHPSSILVSDDGQVRIVDWMIDWNRVPVCNRIHAAEYLAPETLAGATPGAPADQFALGVIAFQLLTGRSPFPGASLGESLFRIRYGLPDRDPLGDMQFAAQILFDRIFSADPGERFESCSAFVRQLEQAPAVRNRAQTAWATAESDGWEQGAKAAGALPKETGFGVDSPARKSGFAWRPAAFALSLLAIGLGALDWNLQGRIGRATSEEAQMQRAQASDTLAGGTFRVCNASPETVKISELAAAYWSPEHRLRVFSSPVYTHEGWVIAPASSQALSWPTSGGKTWDGSVLFYSFRAEEGNKEFVVTGRWDAAGQGCVHLQ
jgi:serine/threonine protein kinase